MNKKKVVAILTAVAVVATLFVGCGTKKVEETKSRSTKNRSSKIS